MALVFWVLPPGLAVLFLAVQLGVFGFYLGAAFALNHIGMPLVPARLKLDFLRRQVLVSRNISGGPVMSVLMGGLNYQVEHHLFPSMARPHLRKAAPLVRAHCAEIGVPYTQISLLQLRAGHPLPAHRQAEGQRPVPLPPGRAASQPVTAAGPRRSSRCCT